MRLRWAVRTVIVAVVGLAGVSLLPSTAEAHTRTEETTNVVSEVTHEPALPELEWIVHTGGLAVELVNHGGATVVIEGYDGEPYLRIGPDGVERNRRSPATYLNDDRFGDVAIPPDVDPQAPPDWIHLDDRPRHVWHDHRTHWMSPEPPPFVDAGGLARTLMDMRLVGTIGVAGDDAGTFSSWAIPFSVDGERHELRGEMRWQDPPSSLPWLAAATLLVLPALLGLRRGDAVQVIRPAAWVVGAVAVVNGIHLVDDVAAWPSDPLDELSGLLHTSTFLIGGIGGAIWALRVDSGRILALGIASGSVLYHQGLVHLPMLFASGFPTVWPDGLVRLTVALGLLQAVVVAVVLRRALRCAPSPESDTDQPTAAPVR